MHKFLNFFQNLGHEVVPSSSLVPHNDPSLMFTNSGMVQFKDVFTGQETRKYTKATTIQKCVRAGGKHNDLDNVGHTKRHLTFFEMMGNFSFGDYFKEQAIAYAWEFLTKEVGLDKEKLYITVYHDDEEAFSIWKKLTSFSDEKIIKIATSDNFWSMGDSGPCGPCSEIFYDQGPSLEGGLPGTKDADGDRFIEIWNLVFMQYEQQTNGTRINLPKQCIDTGMGLERLSAIIEGVYDNFEIKTFKNIILAIQELTLTDAKGHNRIAHRVIADHLRSCAFLIADGVTPSNEGRGYVLRRIIRRAVRYIDSLGYKDILLHKLLPTLTQEMGGRYKELINRQGLIAQSFKQEEELFRVTLDRGIKILSQETASLSRGATLSGEAAFKLHDTYGFPIDLTQDILREKGLLVDSEGFANCMLEQKTRARKAWAGSGESKTESLWFELREKIGATEFLGYVETAAKGAVKSLILDGKQIEELGEEDSEFYIITDQTPFYAESGGQKGDIGRIKNDAGLLIEVLYTQKPVANLHAHLCKLKSGSIKVGDIVDLIVDIENRDCLRKNHTATHLLHAVLRQVLGTQVVQKGSLVAKDYLRLDFSYASQIPRETLDLIERNINALILQNTKVQTQIMSQEEAAKTGAMALFGEKYESEVRVVSIDQHSIELCGGTHVSHLGEIGLFKIINETAVAAGIRRIEAVTSLAALKYFQDNFNTLKAVSTTLHTPVDALVQKSEDLVKKNKELEKTLFRLSQATKSQSLDTSSAIKIGGIDLIAQDLGSQNVLDLREALQTKINSSKGVIITLISKMENKISYLCGVSKDLHNEYTAKQIASQINTKFNGKGGGNEFMAQGTLSADSASGVIAFIKDVCIKNQ